MTTATQQTALDKVIDTFVWAYPNGDTRGEVDVDEDGNLHLVVWTHDNDHPDDEEVHPLDVTRKLEPEDMAWRDEDAARRAIRALIHWFLCHEADEQMFFGNEQPFYPHDETGATISV